MAASSTAWRARLKPMNSRRAPRCTTEVSIRDRGGVLSIARTVTSRHEQASASTTPRTAVAGSVAYSGFEIAARANTRTSSMRLTTAARVAETLRYVAVSRNGFRTIVSPSTSGSHSTPIGAQLMAPSAATVVTIVSMITSSRSCRSRAALLPDERRVGGQQPAGDRTGHAAGDGAAVDAHEGRDAAKRIGQKRLVSGRELVRSNDALLRRYSELRGEPERDAARDSRQGPARQRRRDHGSARDRKQVAGGSLATMPGDAEQERFVRARPLRLDRCGNSVDERQRLQSGVCR